MGFSKLLMVGMESLAGLPGTRMGESLGGPECRLCPSLGAQCSSPGCWEVLGMPLTLTCWRRTVRERLGHVAGSLAAMAPGIRDELPGCLQWTPG